MQVLPLLKVWDSENFGPKPPSRCKVTCRRCGEVLTYIGGSSSSNLKQHLERLHNLDFSQDADDESPNKKMKQTHIGDIFSRSTASTVDQAELLAICWADNAWSFLSLNRKSTKSDAFSFPFNKDRET